MLTICGLTVLTALAAPVTAEQARKTATAFLNSHAGIRRAASATVAGQAVPVASGADGQPLCYAVNIGQDNGFVLVSGSDLTDEILGYSDKGTFRESQMPEAMRAWLLGCTAQIRQAEASGTAIRRGAANSSATKTPIAPLLKSTWDQEKPYNSNCPQLPGSTEQSFTGCTITAMAQIMYYHQWPKAPTTAIPGYTFNYPDNNNVQQSYTMSELPPVTFQWEKMSPSYKSTDDGSAVATLMQYLGQASRADYGLDGTNASGYNALKAMQQYFDYDKGARVIWRNECTYDEWIDMLYDELKARRPVMFSGTAAPNAHSFVVDGYDHADYFHVNWGWNGSSNGYFKVLMMNPKGQGNGGNVDDEAYGMDQVAFFGIQPDKGGSNTAPLALTLISASLYRPAVDTGSWDLEGTESVSPLYATGYTILPAVELRNYNAAEANFDMGLRLVKDDGTLSRDYTWNVERLSNKKYGINDYYIGRIGDFFNIDPREDATLTDGKYKLFFLSKEHTATEWQLCKNSDKIYIELTLDNANSQLKAQLVDNSAKLKVESITFNKTTLMVDEPVDITIKLTNTGKSTYSNDLVFAGKYAGEEMVSIAAGSTCDIMPGETCEALMTWIPRKTGEFYYTVSNHASAEIYSGTVSVQASNSSDNVTLTGTATIANADDQYRIVGNKAVFNITLTNATKQNYNGAVALFNISQNANGQTANNSQFSQQPVDVPANGTHTLTMETKPLTVNASYKFELVYICGGNWETIGLPTDGKTYTVAPYYTIYDAQRKATWHAAAATVKPAADACAIDLTTTATLPTVDRSSANPNLLVYVSQDASLSGDNVVKGSQAENILLTDGHPFYAPTPFTATHISYTRTAEGTYDQQQGKGWSTLMLPFAATGCKTTIGGTATPLTWYKGNGSTAQPDITLMDFQYENGSTIEFGHAGETLQAHRPYLFGTPATIRGQQTLKGQSITFTADNADVRQDSTWVTGRNYMMGGTYAPLTSQQAIYVLNADGNAFVRSTTATLSPFRAYFAPATDRAQDATLTLSADNGTDTGISTLHATGGKADGACYNLQGQQVSRSHKGLVISNGRIYLNK